MATPTLIAIVVSCIVFALFVGLLLLFCRCKRRRSKKGAQVKDYEMDSVRPSMAAQQSQAPPPYYPASGLENKALEHSMDLSMAAMDAVDQKNGGGGSAVYGGPNGGYGYHAQQTLQVPGQQMHGNSDCKLNGVPFARASFPRSTLSFVIVSFRASARTSGPASSARPRPLDISR